MIRMCCQDAVIASLLLLLLQLLYFEPCGEQILCYTPLASSGHDETIQIHNRLQRTMVMTLKNPSIIAIFKDVRLIVTSRHSLSPQDYAQLGISSLQLVP